VAGLFVIHGAPDLALTQLLVETVIVVGFVLGLGHLARRFPPVANTWKATRLVVAGGGGLAVTVALAAAGANPTGRAPIGELTTGAVDQGGGKNVVNVILTDIRALDTLGEVVVLATVSIGILALARAQLSERAP
jgi:multicomponent Na+:H+ antiporter subunit A